jgi:hypothetical protein
MKDLLTFAVLALFTSAHPSLHLGSARQAPPPEKVIVLDRVPTTVSYNWQVQPNHAVPCYAAQCDTYYLPTVDSAPTEDVVLRLLLSDARILVVECRAKEMPILSNAIQLYNGSDADVPLLRTCRVPHLNQETEVVIDGTTVKFSFPATKKDGSATTIVETYHIKGYLTPIPGSDENALTMHPVLDQPVGSNEGTRKCFVTTIPFGAQVYLDGERIGKSPLQLNLPVNGMAHEITVMKDGFATAGKVVRRDDDETHFSFSLAPAR